MIAVPTLIELLADPSTKVRITALRGLQAAPQRQAGRVEREGGDG
jgi:HEAT repeat protein